MDIGPISPIRPATMIKPSSTSPDLSRVYEVEYLGQSADDEYLPADRTPVRGLEDEEQEAEPEVLELEMPEAADPLKKVSLFA